VEKTNPGFIGSFTEVPILGNFPRTLLVSKPHLFSKPALMNVLETAIDIEKLRAQIV
jgi:hypothetical protein